MLPLDADRYAQETNEQRACIDIRGREEGPDGDMPL
jgi:hypothetical protein